MKIILTAILMFVASHFNTTIAQENKVDFKKREDSLMQNVDSMNRVGIKQERIEYCHGFIKQLSHLLKEQGSFNYPFEQLSKKVHILYPEDKSFRIFNWPVEYETAKFRYYGVIQRADGKLFPLIDNSDNINEKSYQNLMDNKDWLGVEIYKVHSEKDIEGKTVYFVFGLNNNKQTTSIKLVDVLSFEGSKVIFGGNYFEGGGNRFLLEYQKGTQVSLNYDNERKLVVFNDLESEINQPQRKHSLVPNGVLNGLKWNNGQWQKEYNLIPVQKLKDGQAPINGVIPGN